MCLYRYRISKGNYRFLQFFLKFKIFTGGIILHSESIYFPKNARTCSTTVGRLVVAESGVLPSTNKVLYRHRIHLSN